MVDYYTKLSAKVVLIATITLCSVIIVLILALVIALFDHRISDEEIFTLLGPAFNTIIGALVGTLAGVQLGRTAPQQLVYEIQEENNVQK